MTPPLSIRRRGSCIDGGVAYSGGMKIHRSTQAVFLFLLALASCARTRPGRGSSTKSNPSLLHYFSGSLSGGVDEMVDAFNQLRPGIHLDATALDHESFKTRVLQAVRAPNPPELLSYWAGARTAAISAHLEPIDSMWDRAGLDSVFDPSVSAAAASYGGRRLLLPITQHLVGFFYNARLLGELGLGEPGDWKAFLDLCAAAKARGITPIALGAHDRWPAQFWFDYLLLRAEGPQVRSRITGGELPFSSDPSRRAFARWRELLEAGYFNEDAVTATWDSDAAMRVRRGEALMTLMGSWLIGYYKGEGEGWEEGRGYGFFPFPDMGGSPIRTALGPIDGVVVPKNAIAKESAMEVLRYLASTEAQEAFSQGSGALSPSLKVSPSIYSPIQEELLAEISVCGEWAFNYDLEAAPALAEVGLDLFKAFLRQPARLNGLLAEADARIQAEAP